MRRTGRALVVGLAAVLGLLGAAVPALAAAPAVSPARASVTIYLPDAFFVGGQPVTVPGRAFHVGIVVRPYVGAQTITLSARVGARVFALRHLRLAASRRHTYGTVTVALSSPDAGGVTLSVEHQTNAAVAAFAAERKLTVLQPSASYGNSGPFVELIQQRLAALHFYIPQTGVFDQGTALALDAYHRLLGWGTSQTLTGATVSYLLDGFGKFTVHYPGRGQARRG